MPYTSPHHDLLLRASSAPVLEKLLQQLQAAQAKKKQHTLSNITKAAWPFFVAALAMRLQPERQLWLISHDVRSQEHLFSELACWLEPLSFFPDLGMVEHRLSLPDPEVVSERLAFLVRSARGEKGASLITARELLETVPSKKELLATVITISCGWKGAPGTMAKKLEELGFERTTQVAHRGEYALRGGILDFFSWQEQLPCRLEFDEEGIVSLRAFDADTQISLRIMESSEIQAADPDHAGVPFADYIEADDLVILLGDDFSEAEKEAITTLSATILRFSEIDSFESLSAQKK